MSFDKERALKIIVIMLSILVVFFAPYGFHLDWGPGPNNIMAILWDISEYFGFQIFESLEYFIYYFFRIVVLYEIIRFLLEKISQKRLILMSGIAELIPLLISIPGALILNSEGENYIPIIISIPTLILFVLLLVWIFSYIKRETLE